MVRLEQIEDLAREFVLVRLLRITGADLNVFDFDYDLTWAAFLMNADEEVYGRYGGRDAGGPDARMSLAGLRYALRAALDAHRRRPAPAAPAPRAKPLLAEDYPAARRFRGGCVHCHQVNEFRREQAQADGTWRRQDVWVYPLPENVGLTLEVDRGDVVRSVRPGSPAARAGLRAGDTLLALNGLPVASFADAQYALHRAPAKGEIPVTWRRDGEARAGTLDVAEGWRKTNLTWRMSLLDLFPSLILTGEDLTSEEKKALGLPEKRLAFRQERPVGSQARSAGIQEGDVIVGIDGQALAMSMDEFFGYVRRNYLVGDRVTFDVLRGGKRIRLPMTLR